MPSSQRRKHLRFTASIITIMMFACAAHVEAQEKITLPKPAFSGKLSVEAAMSKKKSVRNFKPGKLTKAQISQLLWAAYGNSEADATTGATRKVIPSAGGLYPLEIFLLTGQDTVEGLPAGIYRYLPNENSLQLFSQGDSRNLMAHAALGQVFLAQAQAILVISAVFETTRARYRERGDRYVFMEAGNSNQNIYLQAEALGLSVATVGAFNDAQVSAVMKVPNNFTPLLLMPIGK
jgi:SagB-type dehydrogenase family enzyme